MVKKEAKGPDPKDSSKLVKRKLRQTGLREERVTKIKPYHHKAKKNEIYFQASRPIYAYLQRIKKLFMKG